mgnify:CR=1 FL=1
MIEILKSYIVENQKNLNYVRDLQPQNDKWTGTVDYAVARLNTALLRLINDPLKLYEHNQEITECQKIIDDFVKHIRNYYKWPIPFKWLCGIMIHYIGTRKIPRIKKFLNIIND